MNRLAARMGGLGMSLAMLSFLLSGNAGRAVTRPAFFVSGFSDLFESRIL
jgi:hypothetical protein